jgi:putative glutamine amidotransferase
VNALHHQSVDRPGAGLRVVGRDAAGIVQAIEGIDDRFLIGVQWHPEFMIHSRSQQRLFTELVRAAKGAAE